MSRPIYRYLALVLCAGALLFGCDAALDPFAGTAGLYYIYGVFEVTEEEHYVRVQNLNRPPQPEDSAPLNATVTLENLTSGTSTGLVDSTITFDETVTHNFQVDTPIQPGATYRLTVERSDGRRTQATATMPDTTEISLDPAPGSTVPCDRDILLRFRDLPDGTHIRRSVGVRWDGSWRWIQDRLGPANDFIQGGLMPWLIVEKALPTVPLQTINNPKKYCRLLDEKQIRVAYTQFGPDWPPDSVRADPTQSNVENGLGIFGGVRRDTLTWPLGPPVNP